MEGRRIMSIAIHKDKCIGCKKCLCVCPGDLIQEDKNGKAFIEEEKDCWGCTACLKECPVEAIHYYLAEDIGGVGGSLTAKVKKETIQWRIVDQKGKTYEVQTRADQSNQY